MNKAAINAKIGRVRQMYKDGFMDYEEFKRDMTELQESLAKAEAEEKQHEVRDLSAVKKLFETGFTEIYDTLSEEEKRAFWGKIVREIRVYADKRIEVFF